MINLFLEGLQLGSYFFISLNEFSIFSKPSLTSFSRPKRSLASIYFIHVYFTYEIYKIEFKNITIKKLSYFWFVVRFFFPDFFCCLLLLMWGYYNFNIFGCLFFFDFLTRGYFLSNIGFKKVTKDFWSMDKIFFISSNLIFK